MKTLSHAQTNELERDMMRFKNNQAHFQAAPSIIILGHLRLFN